MRFNLRSRLPVAIALLAIVGALAAAHTPLLWDAVSLALAAVAAHEWGRLCGFDRVDQRLHAGGFVVFALLAGIAEPFVQQHYLGVVALLWAFVAPWWVLQKWTLPRALAAAFGLLALYACWRAASLLYANDLPLLAAGLALVWIFDSACFAVGRLIGRAPLAPEISPKKTVEGLLGGIAAVFIAAVLYVAYLSEEQVSVVNALSIAFALSALALLGDLFISMLKRLAGVKDSGALLGDHGGVLDRIDALLPVLPVVALLSPWLG